MESTKCHLCYYPMRAQAQFCTHCGEPRQGKSASGSYKRVSWLELGLLAFVAFFLATGFVGCSIIFPPLLIVSIPAVVLAPILIFGVYWHAVKGPCPYCGTMNHLRKPPAFNCKACKRRVLVTGNAFARVPD